MNYNISDIITDVATEVVDEKKEIPNNKYFTITEKTISVSKEYNIYLYGSIFGAQEYSRIVNLLYSANEGDNINLYVSSYGGDLQVTELLLNALSVCKANTTGIITGTSASAATLLILACHNVIVEYHAQLMFHSYSTYKYGKRNEVKSSLQGLEEKWENLIETYYTGFLTDSEISRLENGEDFWITGKEIENRLSSRINYLKKKRIQIERDAKKSNVKLQVTPVKKVTKKTKTNKKSSPAPTKKTTGKK